MNGISVVYPYGIPESPHTILANNDGDNDNDNNGPSPGIRRQFHVMQNTRRALAAPIAMHTLLWYMVTADGVDKASLQRCHQVLKTCSSAGPPVILLSGWFCLRLALAARLLSITGFPNPATPEAVSSPLLPPPPVVLLASAVACLVIHPSMAQFSRICGAESASSQPSISTIDQASSTYLKIPLYAHHWRLALEALTNPPAPQQHCGQP
ncbi:uncharacterized protein LY79DRAFT_700958 [Colletotrichum navitas]|uniref:Uncharacterized protein n=1 Tax=Colletotrichum navitas TaxID=681940 RepID=A0AAD8V7H1_9PEZI|nr:uncharacterized protein LY79DRAFT_700958 [Colletotrichum navitas]KAK1597137.1 hypothetical protein LY79DRAFT_700958 [Colletotrichum navitas]